MFNIQDTAESLLSRQWFLNQPPEFHILAHDKRNAVTVSDSMVHLVIPAMSAGETLGDIALQKLKLLWRQVLTHS